MFFPLDIRSDSDSVCTESDHERRKDFTKRKTECNEAGHLRRSKERRQKSKLRTRNSKLMHPYQSWPHTQSNCLFALLYLLNEIFLLFNSKTIRETWAHLQVE